MKRVFVLLLFAMMFTSCDPEWALNPKNEGRAYIINRAETDITFKSYSFRGRLHYQYDISVGDTVCVSGSSWDERSNYWQKLVKAGWEPFLGVIAYSDYQHESGELQYLFPTISILTSPTDSLSWTLDVNNIEETSIFNESNWVKEESNDGYHNLYSWYYICE